MDRFDDVSVVTSVDESPPPRPRMPRGRRRALTVSVVASILAVGAFGGAAVGLASEKSEPSAASSVEGPVVTYTGHPCHMDGGRHLRPAHSAASKRY
jgi:hypothetical protein